MNIPYRFMVLDVESNGLYGQPFCVGAVVMNWGGRVLARQCWRCEIDEVEDEWVLEHVIPQLQHIDITVDNLDELCLRFIEWHGLLTEGMHLPIYADIGFPVDHAFLYYLGQCAERRGVPWKSPYPVYDIGSILSARGINTDISREEYAGSMVGIASGRPHDPCWDAELSGLCLIRALRDDL